MAELKLPAVPKPIAAPKLDIPKNTAPDATVRNLTSMTPSNVTKGPMDIIGEMKAGQEKTSKDITTARESQYKSAEAEQFAKTEVEEDVRKAKKEESLKQDKQLDEFMSGQRSKELPYPDFQPTQETGVSIAELGGMLATLGVMLGTGAKGNAIAAVGALRGAMDGWNKGRKDLWQKEMKTFETEVNKMKTHNEQLNKYTQQYLQSYPTRRAEAMQNAEAAIRIAGSNSIFAHTLKTKRAQDVITDLNNLNDATQKTLLQILKVQNQLETQKFNKEKFDETKRHNENMEAIAKLRALKSDSGKPGLLAGRAENIREAFAQAAKDIVNVTKFPEGTMLGTFSGLTGASADSMVSGIRNGIARGVTDKEQRMLETLIAGIEGHLAFALGGGYATSQSKARMDQYKAQLARAGDDPAQVPLMLSRFKQEMNILAENFSSKPGATPEMNQSVQRYNDKINQAVPYTVEDVLSAQFSEEPKPKTSGGAGNWKIKEK